MEHNLLQLEDIVETQELQERQLDHRFQLAMYKEKKLQELERVRGMSHPQNFILSIIYFFFLICKYVVYLIFLIFLESLVKEYGEKMANYERRQCQTLKERQETFGQVFQEDLEQFKQSGKLPGKTLFYTEKASMLLVL